MKYIDLALEYEKKYDVYPPLIATLSPEDREYLEVLQEAIDRNYPLTLEELEEKFMPNKKTLY